MWTHTRHRFFSACVVWLVVLQTSVSSLSDVCNVEPFRGKLPKVFVYDSTRLFTEPWFPPWSEIESSFMNIRHSELYVNRISQADVAFFPVFLASFYYKNLNQAYRGEELDSLAWSMQYRRHNVLLQRAWRRWSKTLAPLSVRSKVKHFVVFSYVCYRCDFRFIPRDIQIVTVETFGSMGAPFDIRYDNGCYDRCITIPYALRKNARLLFSTNFTVSEYSARDCLISFIGDYNRSTSVKRFRTNALTKLPASMRGQECLVTDLHEEADILEQRAIRLYNRSKFSLQLPGDTPTRAGVYQSIIMGCTPVVFESSFAVYANLFRGIFGAEVGKMVLQIPDSLWLLNADPSMIADIISNASSSSTVRERMSLMESLKRFMVWEQSSCNSFNISDPVLLVAQVLAFG